MSRRCDLESVSEVDVVKIPGAVAVKALFVELCRWSCFCEGVEMVRIESRLLCIWRGSCSKLFIFEPLLN